jgi:hypothetical protein
VSVAPNPPRLAPAVAQKPVGSGPGGDGFGPESLGHRLPAIALPTNVTLAAARLLVQGVPAEEIAAMLNALADRYAAARPKRESFEASIVVRGHAGEHKELRWNESRRLGP